MYRPEKKSYLLFKQNEKKKKRSQLTVRQNEELLGAIRDIISVQRKRVRKQKSRQTVVWNIFYKKTR